MSRFLWVALGGALGAVLRYAVSLIPVRGGFPVLTLLTNLLGALLIGFIAGAVEISAPSPGLILFAKTGLCGGFTTFSTFSLESYTLIKAGQKGTAVLYIALSVGLCLLGIWLGHLAARRVFPLS
ncbi:MAG: fluoride efflux transporter CrcB [Angelakisella sp.]